MRFKKTVSKLAIGLSLLGLSITATATPNAKLQVYISPQDYSSAVKLWQYYADYWFYQGELVEPIASKSLKDAFGDVAMCKGTQTGNALMWLRPSIFYNPQMRVYYGTMTAYIYDADGKPVNQVVGESQVLGDLDVRTRQTINKTYHLAMNNLVTKLKADKAVIAALDNDLTAGGTYAACSSVPNLPNNLPPYTPIKNIFFDGVHYN